MPHKSGIRVRISDTNPTPSYPTVKEIRRLVKDEEKLLKDWPKDAILKWTDAHFMCESCGLFYSTLSNLRRHSETHKDNHPCLKCPDCMNEFSRSDALIRHIRDFCPIARIAQSAARPISTGAMQAANEIINQASQTKRKRTFQWALTPIDTDIESSKPKKRRILKRQAVEIPLEGGVILDDPRGVPIPAPTPITDDDARRLEEMLEEEPSPPDAMQQNQKENRQEPEITLPDLEDPNWVEKFTEENPVTAEEDEWLEDLVRPKQYDPWSTEPEKSHTENIFDARSTPEPPPARLNALSSPVLPGTSKNNVQEMPPNDPCASTNNNPNERTPPLELKITLPRAPTENPELPDYVVTVVEENGTIPPWEFDKAFKNVMRSIQYDDEEYLVLDDLRDA